MESSQKSNQYKTSQCFLLLFNLSFFAKFILAFFIIANLLFNQACAERKTLLQLTGPSFYVSSFPIYIGWVNSNNNIKITLQYDDKSSETINLVNYTYQISYYYSYINTITANTFPHTNEFVSSNLGYFYIYIYKPENLKSKVIFQLKVYRNNFLFLNKYFYFVLQQSIYNNQVILGSFNILQDNQNVYISSDQYFDGYIGLKYANGTKLKYSQYEYQYIYWYMLGYSFKIESKQQPIYLFAYYYQYYWKPKFLTVSAQKNCQTIPNSNMSLNQKQCSCNSGYTSIQQDDGSNQCIPQSQAIFDSNLNQSVRNCAMVQNSFGILEVNSAANCKCQISYQWSKTDKVCLTDDLQQKSNLSTKQGYLGIGVAIGLASAIILTFIIFLILCCCGCIICAKCQKEKPQGQKKPQNCAAQSHIVICPICLDPNPQLISKCQHRFHEKCIKEWLSRNKKCPYCMRDLDEQKIYPIKKQEESQDKALSSQHIMYNQMRIQQ